MVAMGLATLLFAAARDIWWLVGRMVLGVAFVSTFQIGVAAGR
jgi:hypothetical protein